MIAQILNYSISTSVPWLTVTGGSSTPGVADLWGVRCDRSTARRIPTVPVEANLAPHGMLLMHISNRHLELAKVVAAVGATENLITIVKTDRNRNDFTVDLRAAAMVAVLAHNEDDLGSLRGAEGWEKVDAGAVAPWTDDYSDIIGSILRKKLGR